MGMSYMTSYPLLDLKRNDWILAMEELGLIDSSWEDDSKGPKRRVYRILDDGRTRLTEWLDVLDSIQGRMNRLIDRYKTNQM